LTCEPRGLRYINSGLHDADVVHNSAIVNLNVAEACKLRNVSMVFFSSSACVYPEHNQLDARRPNTDEETAYPANPDSEYGWEKLFAERIFQTYSRNYGLRAKIARFHNIFGPYGTWDGGKEKAPAALMRKVCTRTWIPPLHTPASHPSIRSQCPLLTVPLRE
jgi:nucleoside-diphosphate-sugar epimerase